MVLGLPKMLGKRKGPDVYKTVTQEDKIVSYENIEKQLEGIGVVTALVLGFAVGQLFCADKAEVIEADNALGTKWTWYGVKPSELMVNVGMTCALLELFAVILDLVLYQFLLNYCRDRENEHQIRIWNSKFGWMLYLLYTMAFVGLLMYFWLLCICFTLRYPEYGDYKNTTVNGITTLTCTDSSCHKYYTRAYNIFLSSVCVGGALLVAYLYFAAVHVSEKINDLRTEQMEVPDSLRKVVDTVLCSVEGAPLELLWEKTSRLAALMDKANTVKDAVHQGGAAALLKGREVKAKAGSKAKALGAKLFGGKRGKAKVGPDGGHTTVAVVAVRSSTKVDELDLADVDVDDEDEVTLLEADAESSGSNYSAAEAHKEWQARHNTMVKCLREFSYFTESELVADRSDQYLLQELVDAGVDNARDRACLVDIFKDGGAKTKKLNKLIYTMVQGVKKDFQKRHNVDAADRLIDEELDQYHAMRYTPPPALGGDSYHIPGIVPPSLTRHSKFIVMMGSNKPQGIEVPETRA